MKVLITATVQSHICQFHRPLIRILHEHGCEVHIAAKDNLAEKNGLKADFVEQIFNVPFSRSPLSKNNIRAYKDIKKIINTGQYDIIHCNTPVGGIITRLAAISAKKHGTKVFYTAHGFHFYRHAAIVNWILYYPLEKFFARHLTDCLITVNLEDERLARDRFRCRVEHIFGVGVDGKRFFPLEIKEKIRLRNEMKFDSDSEIILCVGELLPNKNQQMAIKMMAELVNTHPKAVLILTGNGPEEGRLKRLVATLGLENRVIFLGYVLDIQLYQQIADVVVACSYREGLPLCIVEAMLSGNPVIATENRGHSELLTNKKNGYLVSVNDEHTMSERVKELLENTDTRTSFTEASLCIAKKYDESSVSKELERIYFGVSMKE